MDNWNQNFYFFDAHCHLQEPEIVWDIEGIMSRWKQNRGKSIVCCGTKESNWKAVGDIASQYGNVIPCVGVHPWFVEDVSEKWFYKLDKYLDTSFGCVTSTVYERIKPCIDDKVTKFSTGENAKPFISERRKPFIGEIGLDHVLKHIDQKKQELIFKTQMGMARERHVPVSIHMRKGWDVLIKILKKMGNLKEGGVIHSYSGSSDMVPILEKYGFCISFSGSITHSVNKKVQKSLKVVSPHRLLIETDSPAILPFIDPLSQQVGRFIQPSQELFQMGWNEPCNIHVIATAVSKILGITLPEVALRTSMNGEYLFLK